MLPRKELRISPVYQVTDIWKYRREAVTLQGVPCKLARGEVEICVTKLYIIVLIQADHFCLHIFYIYFILFYQVHKRLFSQCEPKTSLVFDHMIWDAPSLLFPATAMLWRARGQRFWFCFNNTHSRLTRIQHKYRPFSLLYTVYSKLLQKYYSHKKVVELRYIYMYVLKSAGFL